MSDVVYVKDVNFTSLREMEGWILIGIVILYFAIMLFIKLVESLFNDTSFIERQLADYDFDDLDSNIVSLQPHKGMLLSVVYLCDRDVFIIREQITCLSHIISKTFPETRGIEFLCFIPNENKSIMAQMENLQQSIRSIRIFRIDSKSQSKRFVHGALFAKGKFVVDARQLVYELDDLKNSSDNFIKFVHQRGKHNCFTVPVCGTKTALITAFTRLHLLEDGSFYEMDILAKLNEIETIVVEGDIETQGSVLSHLIRRYFMMKFYQSGIYKL